MFASLLVYSAHILRIKLRDGVSTELFQEKKKITTFVYGKHGVSCECKASDWLSDANHLVITF